jgi:hypothetical protein
MIRCRGLRILVELLDEDYSVNRSLILSSLEGVGAVFDLQVGSFTYRMTQLTSSRQLLVMTFAGCL